MSTYSLIYTTVNTVDCAKKIAHNLLENKLAACVHVLPKGVSIYEYDGKLHEDEEHLVVVKTRSGLCVEVMALMRAQHCYDTPALFCTDISNGDDDYLGWISKQTAD